MEPSDWSPKSCSQTFDARFIDVALLQRWLQNCEKHHEGSCSTARLPTTDHDLYLVDVQQSCLVLTSSQSSYIALSYV